MGAKLQCGGSRNQWCACEPAVLVGFRFGEQRSIWHQLNPTRIVRQHTSLLLESTLASVDDCRLGLATVKV